MRLFEIQDAIERILAEGSDPETGEIPDETLAALAELEVAREQKVLDLACYVRGELAEAEAVAAQAKKLKERADRHEYRARRIAKFLEERVLGRGEKLRDARVEVGWRKSSAVVIDEELEIPSDPLLWRVTPPKQEPSKDEIGKRLRSGQDVPGARLEERWNLQIR